MKFWCARPKWPGQKMSPNEGKNDLLRPQYVAANIFFVCGWDDGWVTGAEVIRGRAWHLTSPPEPAQSKDYGSLFWGRNLFLHHLPSQSSMTWFGIHQVRGLEDQSATWRSRTPILRRVGQPKVCLAASLWIITLIWTEWWPIQL